LKGGDSFLHLVHLSLSPFPFPVSTSLPLHTVLKRLLLFLFGFCRSIYYAWVRVGGTCQSVSTSPQQYRGRKIENIDPQRGRANRKSFEVEVANADSILKDVTRVHYQGPVQLHARRLWPFLRMSLGYITKVLYNSTRDDYVHS
jgi:hypothetical protein